MGAENEETLQPNHKPNQISISKDQFLAWKRQKQNKQKQQGNVKKTYIASGRVQMNGRELILHQPWVFDDTYH